MRIRWRLALLGTVLATGTVSLFAVLLVLLASASAPSDQVKNLDALAARAAASFRTGGAPAVLVVDAAVSTDPFVLVTDGAGTVVYAQGLVQGEPPAVPQTLVRQAEQVKTGGDPATATTTVATPKGPVELRMVARPWSGGVAVAAQSTQFSRSQLAGLQVALLVAALATALAGAIASWVVSGRALRPLRRLADTAAQVARTGDVSRRLPAAKGRDEVADLTREFNAMMDRLHAGQAALATALEQQRRFVADASHELRTPLATIRANAGFLARRPDAATTDRAEAVDDLRAEAERMTGLVDDLLMLARTDALPRPERRPVDLRLIAQDVCRIAGPSVVTDGGPGVVVPGDEAMLRRALTCLVDNAVRHGGGTAVRVEVLVQGPWCVVAVVDSGPGIPPALRNLVFERFYRADPARSGEGSGLGLAIVQAVVRRHGGAVSIGEAPGGGAQVVVHLPAA